MLSFTTSANACDAMKCLTRKIRPAPRPLVDGGRPSAQLLSIKGSPRPRLEQHDSDQRSKTKKPTSGCIHHELLPFAQSHHGGDRPRSAFPDLKGAAYKAEWGECRNDPTTYFRSNS